MTPMVITAVADPPGAGKTTWIRQQLAQARAKGLYVCLDRDVPIDQTYIAIECPQVQISKAERKSQLLNQLNSGDCAYIELGFHLDLATISQLLDTLNCRRIAIVPQRFSGLEVWGQNLNEAAIAQTLKDCCLSSAEIQYYQQQVKELLLEEARG